MGTSAPPTLIAIMVLLSENSDDEKNNRGRGNVGRVMSVVAFILNRGKLIKLPIKVLPSNNTAESGDNPSLAKTIPNTPSCKIMTSRMDSINKYKSGIIYTNVFTASAKSLLNGILFVVCEILSLLQMFFMFAFNNVFIASLVNNACVTRTSTCFAPAV